ncbi:MAG TPA: MmgE/PrpD family protein [Vicinamibacterales bacterium]|nr:MmgE/PrpD family protein [Vicinamibacterales bacterium]
MISRKAFLRLAAAAPLLPAAMSAQTKPKKVEKAAIKGTTDALVRFITETRLARVPADVVAQAKRCLVDGFGVVLAGSTVKGSQIVRDYVRTVSDRKEATSLGEASLVTTAAHAALLNAASGHAMDYDDTQLSTSPDRTFGLLTHPTVPALAAALAVAERKHASGAAFLEAFIVGFEVECKIAEAIDPDHYNHGFHSTGTIGTFAGAAAAAKLMNLPAPQVRHMLTIASSMSSGIRVNFGSMTKPLHSARAAENGVVAAELASRGFTGGDDGLDGQWGFFQVFGGGADLDRLIPVLGRPYTMVNPGSSFKPYPCGSLSHPTMDAMLKAVTDNDIKPEQVRAVRVRAGSNVLDPLRYKIATNELEAKFCLPFLMASLIVRRKAGVKEFTDEFVKSAPVQQMMPKVSNIFDPKIEAQGFDKIRSVVEIDVVVAGNVRTIVQQADERYRGGPEKPFTPQELHAKFADCAQLTMSAGRIPKAIDRIEGVERLKDVGELITALA